METFAYVSRFSYISLEEEPIILHVTPPAVSQADQICQDPQDQ